MKWPLLTIAVLSLGLSGCVGIVYREMPVDSASPAPQDRVRCKGELRQGERCSAMIKANQWTTQTGVVVTHPGERYCITVPPNQVWFDDTRRRTPPTGELGSPLMRIAPLRHEGVGFFALMVDVPAVADYSVSPSAEPVDDRPDYVYTAKSPGNLVLYPNDALGGKQDPAYFYTSNNRGFIWVLIKRCGA